jgi:hypothetical protein
MVLKQRDTIEKDPMMYWVQMGDLNDLVLPKDKRFQANLMPSWINAANIRHDIEEHSKEVLKPIAPKCLAFLVGNHETEFNKFYNEDIGRNLCESLDMPYAGYSCFLELIFRRGKDINSRGGNWRLLFHLWHGSGSSQTEGARVMRLMRLVNDIEADIYMMGHLHTTAVYTPDRLFLSQNGRIKSKKLAAVITGSGLKTYDQPKEGQKISIGYGEEKGYKPARIGWPVIEISPDDRDFRVIA